MLHQRLTASLVKVERTPKTGLRLLTKGHIFTEIHPESANAERSDYEDEMKQQDVISDSTDYFTETLLNAWGRITHVPNEVFHNIQMFICHRFPGSIVLRAL